MRGGYPTPKPPLWWAARGPFGSGGSGWSGNAGIAYAQFGSALGVPLTLVVPGNAGSSVSVCARHSLADGNPWSYLLVPANPATRGTSRVEHRQRRQLHREGVPL